jgi:uncharacterized protein involved in tolerance to divalent cations
MIRKSSSVYEELVLTCSSWQKAQAIADELLKKNLVSTVEFMEVYASQELKEIKLIMRNVVNSFHDVESELVKLQGHKDFVLERSQLTEITSQQQ